MPFSALSSKALLASILLLLLPYSFNTQALSASTANTIQGTSPYLTVDNGITKVTTTAGLLAIKLSDGSTPAPNNTTPITLPAAGQTFADIEMLVPPTAPHGTATDPFTQKISLNDMIGSPYNYWGDDDGDGQGASGITGTGSLSVMITDNNGNKVSRGDMLTTCNGAAPYKVVLTSTVGSLKTQYGDPSKIDFTASNATYYINPVSGPAVCFAKPFSMHLSRNRYAGPPSMWDGGTTDGDNGVQSDGKGFITQSTSSTGYGRNFPTTGANGVYFDLDIDGSATALTWAPVTVNGITATMTAATPTSVRVTLTGPTATTPTKLPTGNFSTRGSTFVLEGKSGSTTIVKYGFTIKKWFINNGWTFGTQLVNANWCAGLGYRLPRVNELTNAMGTDGNTGVAIPGATPGYSGQNVYSRAIDGGLTAEWGELDMYGTPPNGIGFVTAWYWTSDVVNPTFTFAVSMTQGEAWTSTSTALPAACVYP